LLLLTVWTRWLPASLCLARAKSGRASEAIQSKKLALLGVADLRLAARSPQRARRFPTPLERGRAGKADGLFPRLAEFPRVLSPPSQSGEVTSCDPYELAEVC